MPGRPRMMLRGVERLEVAAYDLANAVFQTIPDQYRTRPDGDDFIAETWKEALHAAIHAWTMSGDLGDTLREKAGIRGDGPTTECRLLRPGEAAVSIRRCRRTRRKSAASRCPWRLRA